MFKRQWLMAVLAIMVLLAPARTMFGQLDQGTITGVIQDPSGAVVGNASVTLTNLDEGQVMQSKSDGSGVYVFSPIKIGNYKITATAPGFETTTQENLHLNIQQRLNVVIKLKPGAVTETITVSEEPPLMQTQDSSVGQTMTAEQINEVPLSGRNWVYIAQLSAGASLPTGSRGGGSGDFNANGQRAEENNFILDGVDNNANVVDFYNGASYVVNPPPDALAEFKIQTSNYSAEFGHSAGAVVNASIKAGTNSIHGSLWEYVRNNALGEAPDTEWSHGATTPVPVAPYHQNMFGATLGGPILKNKLFLFADTQANRVVYNSPQLINVPTALERTGDFSELLNPALLDNNTPIQLYTQDPTGVNAPVPIPNNCMIATCTSGGGANLTLDKNALSILSQYPKPNTNGGKLYNNYSTTAPVIENTFQWDVRTDWTISNGDSAYSRYSYYNEVGSNWGSVPVLGPILDGGGFGEGKNKNYGANYMASETHTFSPTVVNEARFGFNYLHTGFQQPNASNAGLAQAQGFGGIPAGPLNGGLPNSYFDGTDSPHSFGAPTWAATDEHENVYQIIDNVTKIAGNHALKAGVQYENIRFATLQPQEPRGEYDFNNRGTSQPGNGNSGYGVADFLLDQVKWAQLSNAVVDRDQRANFSTYAQDDWRLRSNLTVNLGVRWEYFQPYKEISGNQASFFFTSVPTLSATGVPSVQGQYLIPAQSQSRASAIIKTNGFDAALAKDGLNIVYDSNSRLQTTQNLNFAPRVGASWSPDSKTAVRAGFGIFFGGLESLGYWGNLGENYPFQVSAGWDSPGCGANYCQQPGTIAGENITIENGFNTILNTAAGINGVVTGLSLRGTKAAAKSTYTEDWNLSIERSFLQEMVGTISYVGDTSRHLIMNTDANAQLALVNPDYNGQSVRPMPDYGGSAYTQFDGMSDYHSLQAKLEKRMAHGYNFVANYTWSHSLDNTPTPLGSSGYDDSNIRQTNLIPFQDDYSNSPWDVRQRFTLNALYELPFGRGKAYLNQNRVLDLIVGGWASNATFTAQTGEHFTIGQSGNNNWGAQGFGSGPNAVRIASEFATGGTSTNGATCASSVKSLAHWFNPCSYVNAWDSGDTSLKNNDGSKVPNPHYIPNGANDSNTPAGDTTPAYVKDLASVLGYAGGRRNNAVGPGYERVNMAVFKDFTTYREQKLTFRAEAFNLFNTPTWGVPAGNDGSNGGQITSTRSLQSLAPDPRFLQLSLKYTF